MEDNKNNKTDAREISRKKDLEGVTFQYTAPVNFLLERLVLLGMFYAEFDGLKDYFYSDSKCIGCGTCERVCLSGKIKMIDNKPVWQKDIKCDMCYACLNYCPVQAVQIKSKWYMNSYTEENERYPHPYAAADDIAGQKRRRKLNENKDYSSFIHW
ncbi:MAG: EFR1 family ferrodoxin [Euryarchaeota archaeon]|nr:EFR1 family ferrodoxin [Euryarchaeota archaeon]MBV1755904.1 EFR1 family ferrodoxin [Methanobacterium sp.]